MFKSLVQAIFRKQGKIEVRPTGHALSLPEKSPSYSLKQEPSLNLSEEFQLEVENEIRKHTEWLGAARSRGDAKEISYYGERLNFWQKARRVKSPFLDKQ